MKKLSIICLFAICLLSCINKDPETKEKKSKPDSILLKDPLRPPNSAYPHNATYCNHRYGYCITYPDQILRLQPEAPNGDGCVFNNLDGTEFVRVFGRTNPDPEGGKIDLEEEMKEEIISFLKDSSQTHATVTYSKVGKNVYVFSGKKDGKIYYQKAIAKGDDIAIAIFKYDEQQKADCDVIVTTMAKSFH